MVTVVNVDPEEVTLSLPSAALANYLRLHLPGLNQEIAHQFGVSPKIHVLTRPQNRVVDNPAANSGQPRRRDNPVSEKARLRVGSTAGLVDDEELGAALNRLAAHLPSNNEGG